MRAVLLFAAIVVSFAAGRYKTIVVRSEIPDGAGALRSSVWYAPEVGMVKQVIADGDKTITLSLERFEKESAPKINKKNSPKP